MATKPRIHRLIEIDWPEFGVGEFPSRPSAEELGARIEKLRLKMEEGKLTHAVIYGDREHFANLAYLTGFDPRFEEAVLIVSSAGTTLILVGNECQSYLAVSSLHTSGRMRHERFQSFSLLNQPRDRSRNLREIFADENIGLRHAWDVWDGSTSLKMSTPMRLMLWIYRRISWTPFGCFPGETT